MELDERRHGLPYVRRCTSVTAMTKALRFAGVPVSVLTTTGRRSGEQRTTTVLYGEDDGSFVVIGSNTGSERAPARR